MDKLGMVLLRLEGLTQRFGGLTAVDGLDLEVNQGQIMGLIGPNGAGKTTVFNTICGVYKPTGGKVFYNSEDITGLRVDRVADKGLVRTFQNSILFRNFTVLDNVRLGFHLHTNQGLLGGLVGTHSYHQREREIIEKVKETLAFTGLDRLGDEIASNLPHGLQRRLGVTIALATEPKMILLDEPATGLNPKESDDMMTLLQRIREKGITILLVEHSMRMVMSVCDEIVVMNFGKRIANGRPSEIRQNNNVIEAYLGAEDVT